MKWYALQVLTDSENQVRDDLEKRGVTALTPIEQRVLRSRGTWITKGYPIFPGYVFVNLDYTAQSFHLLKDIGGVVRILSDNSGAPIPLTERESHWIRWLGEQLVRPSEVELLPDGKYRVVSGALKLMEKQIVRLNRHRRRAAVAFTLAGKPVRIVFSFVPTNA